MGALLVYGDEPGPAYVRALRHVAEAEPENHPAERRQRGVPAQVPLPVDQPSVEGRAVELHRDLHLRPRGVQVHRPAREIDPVLEQRSRQAGKRDDVPQAADLHVALTAGGEEPEQLRQGRSCGQLRAIRQLVLDRPDGHES